jgi:hypothetical protein
MPPALVRDAESNPSIENAIDRKFSHGLARQAVLSRLMLYMGPLDA